MSRCRYWEQAYCSGSRASTATGYKCSFGRYWARALPSVCALRPRQRRQQGGLTRRLRAWVARQRGAFRSADAAAALGVEPWAVVDLMRQAGAYKIAGKPGCAGIWVKRLLP